MKTVILILLFSSAAFIAGNYFNFSTSSEEAALEQAEPLYWVAPMDPAFRRDQPGKSPMGMDLIPVYADDNQQSEEGVVFISPAMENNLGVKTAPSSLC